MGSRKGIFCLEGDWSRDLRQPSSVEPILSLLSRWDPHYIRYIHRNVATSSSLAKYLLTWATRSYAHFPILYLAFHGNPGVICLDNVCSNDNEVSLDWLEETLRGRCRGRIIYLASCGTMHPHGNRLNRFLRETGALAVCGYSDEVDWLTSTAFELLVMGAMQDNAFTVQGARAMKRRILREAGFLARRLQFRMVIRRAS